jgi:signal transduction histidine kinase
MQCDGNEVAITVEDCGPGIDAAQIPAMFEPFARADSSRNRALGGSGLGLTIARAIARAHGGDVILENRAEGGLRAILTIDQR